MFDFDCAIQNTKSYGKELENLKSLLSANKTIPIDDVTNIEIKYEQYIRPYVSAVNLHDPGKEIWHTEIIEYDNPIELFLKKKQLYNAHRAIIFLHRLQGRLQYYKENPEQFGTSIGKPDIESALARVQQAMRMFDTSAKILANRRKDKQTLIITDEYDVRDILHCILKPQFPDINPEEHSPPVAKGEKRIDLVIKSARIVIELKIIFYKQKILKIVDELKVDIESYHTHPSCGTLIIFVYNPENAIEDPKMIMADLSGTRTKGDHTFEVIVEIYPR